MPDRLAAGSRGGGCGTFWPAPAARRSTSVVAAPRIRRSCCVKGHVGSVSIRHRGKLPFLLTEQRPPFCPARRLRDRPGLSSISGHKSIRRDLARLSQAEASRKRRPVLMVANTGSPRGRRPRAAVTASGQCKSPPPVAGCPWTSWRSPCRPRRRLAGPLKRGLEAGDVLGWLESAAGTNDVVRLAEER